ncbi:protein CC2D2B-like [Alosa sapidissima]|uniref:protein CC2D2B-like n=1 Tax=Alosa sapidissima TaxID=34773 RepID=UPI001C08DE7D|nr:protein CC2D2B-like [Alosa sapidissima]XP_041921867.1 protein CC2D2B-like [Alosa sapidissima]
MTESNSPSVENAVLTLESSEENNCEVSEEDAYRFFCHPFCVEERDSSDSSETNSDFIIDIEDDSPLVSGVTVHTEVDRKRLYVPLDTAVELEDILPKGTEPRSLDDEGIYVCERIQMPRKMYDKMSHRLLDQHKGECWFGKDGCLNTLPNPMKNYWRAKIDFPFPSISAGLTTRYIKSVVVGGGSETKPATSCWQLDLNLIGIQFTHHSLFSREHVLASRLLGLCESYKNRRGIDKTTYLQEKLRALKKSKKDMDAQSHTSAVRSKALNSQIRETQRTLRVIKEEDALLLRNIITTWQCLKDLRTRNHYVSSSVKLQFQRVELKAATRDGTSVQFATEGTPTDSTAGSTIAEEEDGSIFVDDDMIFSQNLMSEGLQDILNAYNRKERAGDGLHRTAPRRMSHFPYIPVLRMNEMITSDLKCDSLEYCRRAALRDSKISVKIFYNGKLVSVTSRSPFHHDFRVNIEETFNMQVTNWPESLMLEIHEHKKFRSTLLAKVYLPIPHRNITSTSAPVETSEFSSDQLVKDSFTGVGGNVFFKMNDNDKEHMCLLTSAKLYYVLSWAEDEWGLPKAPPADPVLPSFSSLPAQLTRRQLEWLMRLRIDPNHPANTSLYELMAEMRHIQENPSSRFHLESAEDYFATDEQLDASRRFGLLRLRSQHAIPSRPIPLHDWQTPPALTEDYEGCHNEPPRETDCITAQRKWAVQYFQKLVSGVQKDLHHMDKKYNLSDIVREVERFQIPPLPDPPPSNMNTRRPSQQLRPSRQNNKGVPPGLLSDGDLTIRVDVQRAVNLPIRQQTYHHMENRGPYCGLSSGKQFFIRWTHKDDLQDQLQPFAEVKFQRSSFETNIAEGPDPIWREEFCLDFSSPDGDYSHAGLAKVQDDIIINVFDVVSFQLTERHTLRGCGTQTFLGKQWLGSVNIPFRALLKQSKISCTFKINTPPALLGYTWSRNDFHSNPAKQRKASYLTVYIVLDPPISSQEDLSNMDIDQKRLWVFPSPVSDADLVLAKQFESACRAVGKKRRFFSTVVNSEGQLVLATKFIRPLRPPPEVLHIDDEEEQHQSKLASLKKIAAFVSLIPVLPSSSEVGDYGEMWLTSEQCLDLVIGNSVSLAVLLCNFFLYLKVQAWVLLGTSIIEGETAYVLTTGCAGDLVWNPKDGKHYSLYDAYCPIIKMDCVVSGRNVWFYKSKERAMPQDFELSETSTWIALFPGDPPAKPAEESPVIQYRLPQSQLVEVLQRRMEKHLKQRLMEWRSPHPTRWNRRLPILLSEILPKFEMLDDTSSMEEELYTLPVQMSDFKVTGMTLHMAFTNMDAVTERVQNAQIHSTEIPGTEFALSVYIHPYPNDILSVWVLLASLVVQQR